MAHCSMIPMPNVTTTAIITVKDTIAAIITVVTTAIYWAAYRSFRHLYVRLVEIIRRRRNKNA